MSYLIILYIVGGLGDLYFTLKGCKEGIFSEANPIFKPFLQSKKYIEVIILKISIIIGTSIIFYLSKSMVLGKIGIILGFLIQIYILYRHYLYRKIYYNEMRKYR